jgi:hypothetical protein
MGWLCPLRKLPYPRGIILDVDDEPQKKKDYDDEPHGYMTTIITTI